MAVIGEVYLSSSFSYLKEQKIFTGEISELPGVLRQLWDDSMDLGFGIRSERTGVVIYYTLHGVERDPDGDVISWYFIPADNSIRRYPQAEGTSVVILND